MRQPPSGKVPSGNGFLTAYDYYVASNGYMTHEAYGISQSQSAAPIAGRAGRLRDGKFGKSVKRCFRHVERTRDNRSYRR